MMLLPMLLAAALVPAPREITETGGTCDVSFPRSLAAWEEPDLDVRAEGLKAVRITYAEDASLPAEGYRLKVAPDGVTITSSGASGRFYAFETLKQLTEVTGTNSISITNCEISDAPAYAYRGMLIDDARHFLGKASVKKIMDQMAAHKLNYLHWHLVDDQGWRLELKRHPEIVEYGSVRPFSPKMGAHPRHLPPKHRREYVHDTDRYGPFYYTQEDVKELLAYAKERFITVIPEIEVPGHVRALLAAHPELSCRGDVPRVPKTDWGIDSDVLCVGNDAGVRLLEEIYDEVCELFPDTPYIHIGGDECPRERWKACPKCRARMKAGNMKDADGLQAWITSHFVKYLEKKGRRAIGWDEMLAGDVPVSAVGMTWRTNPATGAKTAFVSAREAAERGHDMILTPIDTCYFSRSQFRKGDPYPYYSLTRPPLTLEMAYGYDPCENIPEASRRHILGGQASIWGESVFTIFDFEWRAWPRSCATAECLWLGDRKPGFADFKARLQKHRERLIEQGVNCAPVENDGLTAAPKGRDLGPVLTDVEIRTCGKLKGKKAAAFVDDVLWALRDLTRTNPRSVWEVPFFRMLKECHDRYGLKIQLNLFYRADVFYGADEFSLADVPDRFKDEFQGAKDWLRFGFHSQHEFPDYPWVNIDYADMKFFFERIQKEVRRFAGEGMFAKAVVPHWLPVSKDGCRAMKDCGATVICCTDGPRIAYEGDPSVLPYGHAARVEHNRKPETALYHRVCNDVAIAASVAAYNHTTTAQTEETCGRLRYVYDRTTGLAFKRFRSAPMLNLDKLEDLEREFTKSLRYDFMCFANHEQYFYPDYLAYQPDYGAKMLFASKFAHDHGYEFVFIEDTVD